MDEKELKSLADDAINKFDASRKNIARGNYFGLLNAFVCTSMILKFAPSSIDVFKIGINIPLIFVPAILLIVQIILVRTGTEKMLLQLGALAKIIKIAEEEAIKQVYAKNVKEQEKYMSVMSYQGHKLQYLHGKDLVSNIGFYAGLLIFIVVATVITNIYFPDLHFGSLWEKTKAIVLWLCAAAIYIELTGKVFTIQSEGGFQNYLERYYLKD